MIVQATLSVVLVAGATMLARSLSNLEDQDFGYEISGRVIATLHNPTSDYHATEAKRAVSTDGRKLEPFARSERSWD